ncbi:MAG: hypothetical protein JWP75_296 [Frondihabitans sp.]|nr:hypothetical protein [Frondihabitans sp.]
MSTTTTTRTQTGPVTQPAQGAVVVVGVFLIVIGIIGFIPGITTGVDKITFGGPFSGALVFNIFQTSVLQNAVHILLGLAAFGAARKRASSTLYLLGMSTLFFGFWLYGLLFNGSFAGNIFPFNYPDYAFNVSMGFALMILAAATSSLALKGTKYDDDDSYGLFS